MNTTELAYPVLCLSRDGSISVADGAERLRRCNALAYYKNRYYENMIVIDSRARCFRVTQADVVPRPSPSGRWMAKILNRRMQVDLRLEEQGTASLVDAKQVVSEWFGRVPDLWEASRDIGEWKDLVARAGSAGELIALFS